MEAEIIEAYLPQELSDAELEALVKAGGVDRSVVPA